MLTSPDMPTPEQPENKMSIENTPNAPQDDITQAIQMLDNHISALPKDVQDQLADGFRNYDDLPELFGIILPDAYEYFKLVQQGVRGQSQQPQPNSPAASLEATPAGEPAQTPLLGSATQPAKATSALSGMAQ